jgi:flagellar hook-basal body complex protein FliE
MQAHLEMGEKNIRIEDVMAAADENGRSLAATLDIVNRTVEADKTEHAEEYAEDR